MTSGAYPPPTEIALNDTPTDASMRAIKDASQNVPAPIVADPDARIIGQPPLPILEVKNLTKLYRNGRGVKNMSFTLKRGDVFGLLGSNGSGKTTSIKSICGLCPFKGEIKIFGESVSENPRAALRGVGCIVEAPSFYANLTAKQNLSLTAAYYGMSKKQASDAVDWALDIVGLAGYRNERAERFSLGMKARLGLALCFVSKPEFMALDEPLNGLDIEGMVEIRNIIIEQASISGATFLISSHLAAEIEKTCNCLGVMDEGELLETARMDEALAAHGSVEAYYLNVLHKRRESAGGGVLT
jgi:ABC-2 type transport system ATP-binding protein